MVKKPQAKSTPWRPARHEYEEYGDYYGTSAAQPQSWQWWRGSWSARSPKGGQTSTAIAETRYDQTAIAKANQRPPARQDGEDGVSDSHGRVLQAVQRSITHARKMDAKMRKLQEDRRVKALQWDAYAADTKEKFLRQRRAYELDIQRIEQEMAQATAAGKEAADKVKELVNRGADAIDNKEARMDQGCWDALMASETEDTGVFLAQALQAARGGTTATSTRQLRPELLQQLFGMASLPQFGHPSADPPGLPATSNSYLASQPPGLEERDASAEQFATASPRPAAPAAAEPAAPAAKPPPSDRGTHGTLPHHPGQREAGALRQFTSVEPPRQDIKKASMKPQGTVPMGGPSLGEKLDQKREAERRSAMQPFGRSGRPSDTSLTAETQAGNETRTTAFVEDDPDLQAPVSPGFAGME
eukprot:s712_g17.t1